MPHCFAYTQTQTHAHTHTERERERDREREEITSRFRKSVSLKNTSSKIFLGCPPAVPWWWRIMVPVDYLACSSVHGGGGGFACTWLLLPGGEKTGVFTLEENQTDFGLSVGSVARRQSCFSYVVVGHETDVRLPRTFAIANQETEGQPPLSHTCIIQFYTRKEYCPAGVCVYIYI